MLKPTLLSLVLGMVCSFSILNAQVAAEAQQEIAETLLGEWTTDSLQMGANPAPKEIVANSSLTVTAEKLTLTGFGPEETVCNYVIDTSVTPNTIKFKPDEEEEWVKGIVKVTEDGKVMMCLARPGSDDLPTEFATGEDTPSVMLMVLKKAEE